MRLPAGGWRTNTGSEQHLASLSVSERFNVITCSTVKILSWFKSLWGRRDTKTANRGLCFRHRLLFEEAHSKSKYSISVNSNQSVSNSLSIQHHGISKSLLQPWPLIFWWQHLLMGISGTKHVTLVHFFLPHTPQDPQKASQSRRFLCGKSE